MDVGLHYPEASGSAQARWRRPTGVSATVSGNYQSPRLQARSPVTGRRIIGLIGQGRMLARLQERTIMGPYGINRAVHRVVFSDCENGLGIKIIGGFKEQTGEEYGIYVKRILQRGIAASDGRLQAGDLILEVNGEDLMGVTNERAVDILRMASASNHMSLLIARDDEARKEFAELMEKYDCHSDAGSARSSPTPHAAGKHLESTSSTSLCSCPSPQLLSPNDIVASNSGIVTTNTAAPTRRNSPIQLISIPKVTNLGLNIVGGTNKPEGPMVCIQELIPGGDCHKMLPDLLCFSSNTLSTLIPRICSPHFLLFALNVTENPTPRANSLQCAFNRISLCKKQSSVTPEGFIHCLS
ncbi:PH and SEC7 domain-containing protein-like [Chiloscyllium plagiosum]|uniref:PH and SEC7 domain-containing protein-like n=1 Tax=Chiloscyllium plagiosum TaxID=36176 RepID=UPI001CB831B3|nr:PH and SEC7 domain-containing protein-like [Chiloscyllium plagiosum]